MECPQLHKSGRNTNLGPGTTIEPAGLPNEESTLRLGFVFRLSPTRRPSIRVQLHPPTQYTTAMDEETQNPPVQPRRTFLAGMSAVFVGTVAALVPVLSGATSLLDPLRRKRNEAGMSRVTTLAVLPNDGTPKKFTITADLADAWTIHRDAPIGAVYLRKVGEDVHALNVVCPHAGCFVGIAKDRPGFTCPCHKSSFDLAGVIDDPASPSPRDMDSLQVEVRNGDEIWVRFQSFQAGHTVKTPVQ